MQLTDWRCETGEPSNKGMKLTKLSAAPLPDGQKGNGWRCRLMPALAEAV
jgi:hypothetical protein